MERFWTRDIFKSLVLLTSFLSITLLGIVSVLILSLSAELDRNVVAEKETRTRQANQITERITQHLGEKKSPYQLFDINLEIDQHSITDIQELTSRVIFTSFGIVPTPVNLTFTILDDAGKEVHSQKDYITVETEAVLTEKFEDIELLPGKYTLFLKTLYNVDVEDEFRQDFEIIKPIRPWQTAWFQGLTLLGILLVIFLLLVIILTVIWGWSSIRNKRKEEKIE